MANQRWVEASRFLDLEPIEDQRRELIGWQRNPPRVSAMTIEDLLRADPEMPRAVAEYQVAQFQRHRDRGASDHVSFLFANVFDTTTLKQMSRLELGARWLEAHDFRYQFRRARENSPGCQGLALPDSAFPALPTTRSVIGAIVRGDTAYVLQRYTDNMAERGVVRVPPKPDVLVLRRRQDWLIIPDEMVFGGGGSVGVMCGPQNDR